MLSAETSEERLLNLIRNSDQSYLEAHGHQPESVSVKEFAPRIETGTTRRSSPVGWIGLVLLGIALAIGPTMLYSLQRTAQPPRAVTPDPVNEIAVTKPVVTAQTVSARPAQRSRVRAYEPVSPPRLAADNPVSLPAPERDMARPADPVYERFRILGLMIGADSNAVLEDRRSKQIYTVHVGERIDGIVVKDIRPEKVIFDSAGRISELTR